ncbi:hypothetical protein NONI108955_25465 [Nocardia ninae]
MRRMWSEFSPENRGPSTICTDATGTSTATFADASSGKVSALIFSAVFINLASAPLRRALPRFVSVTEVLPSTTRNPAEYALHCSAGPSRRVDRSIDRPQLQGATCRLRRVGMNRLQLIPHVLCTPSLWVVRHEAPTELHRPQWPRTPRLDRLETIGISQAVPGRWRRFRRPDCVISDAAGHLSLHTDRLPMSNVMDLLRGVNCRQFGDMEVRPAGMAGGRTRSKLQSFAHGCRLFGDVLVRSLSVSPSGMATETQVSRCVGRESAQ